MWLGSSGSFGGLKNSADFEFSATYLPYWVAITTEPSLSLPDVDLGTTLVGLESDEWYVAVINNGPTSFVPSVVTVSDGRFAVNDETSTCTFGAPVPPGGDCTVLLTFTPTSPGPVSAELRVAEEGFEALTVTSRVSGAGNGHGDRHGKIRTLAFPDDPNALRSDSGCRKWKPDLPVVVNRIANQPVVK